MLIVEKGLITEAQLELALVEQQTTGARLGEVLMAQFGVTRADLESALTAQRAEIQSHGTQEDSEANAAVRELARMLDEWGRNDAAAPKRPIGEIFVERGLHHERAARRCARGAEAQRPQAGRDPGLAGQAVEAPPLGRARGPGRQLRDAEAGGIGKRTARTAGRVRRTHGHDAQRRRGAGGDVAAAGRPANSAPSTLRRSPLQPTSDVTGLRDELAALAARIDELPQPSEEWREAVTELGARLDELVDGSSESQSALQQLAEQLDEERNADRELDAQVSALAQRVDRLADEVAARIDQVTDKVTAAAELSETDALRHDLDAAPRIARRVAGADG